MKYAALALVLFQAFLAPLPAQSTALFDDQHVGSIYLSLPADSLNFMIATLANEHYFKARFIFDDGETRDTIDNAGLRLRGNTSLGSAKKSFKVSFNEYEPGREYQGVRKLNLLGSHNDPTMVREKLFYEVWARAGMPERRTAFVKLYINNEYRGLYTNAEEIDKAWLGRVFADNDGNLYKCTWPADLAYLGPGQQAYKAILNNPAERAYDLKTNETADDYSRLVALITALNQPVDDNFPAQIEQILNVNSVLKAFAIDVATGNWDDYFYNKNNYYLYDNPATGRFEFVTYDADNTFGVDWFGIDWATRNCLSWQNANQSRPLATQLLAVPAYHTRYLRYLDTLSRFIILPDSIFPLIDTFHLAVFTPAVTDAYRSLDYGYTLADFHLGFVETVDGHTPYGIKPFLTLRSSSIQSQIAGLLSATANPETEFYRVSIYPNPASGRLFVKTDAPAFGEKFNFTLMESSGRTIETWQWEASAQPFEVPIATLPNGSYLLQWTAGDQIGQSIFIKIAE